jgi:hypothetical protein
MARIFFLALSILITALPARAADEPAGKGTAKGGSKVERALDKAGAAIGRTADKAVGGVKKGVDKTTKAIETAGNKTGRWLKEKTQ